ncbi:unnamed protein product, partial [Iphiclides podalirius]
MTDSVTSNCMLTLKTDFGEPSPVYIKNGTYLAPNTPSGDILLRRSETLLVGCPGNKKFVVLGNDTTDVNYVEAQCVANTTFRAGRWLGRFKDIRCSSLPWFTAEETSDYCAERSKLFRVGYQIGGNFYKLYEACFDRGLLTTVYVHHTVTPLSHFMQNGSRPNFIEGDLFGKIKMTKVYAVENQRARLKATLGAGADQTYITKKQFLNRGHLAARADFIMRAAQKASFHYINAAPQWMRGNAGDWAALEEAVRRRISKYGRAVSVYTGTHGVSWLTDSLGLPKGLFLLTDENNNAVVPVPLYFYKLVYDPEELKAVAFVSINSSYYNRSTVEGLTFCRDVCAGSRDYSWLRWRPGDGTHSFCCDYRDFVRVVTHLPKLKVEGLFY